MYVQMQNYKEILNGKLNEYSLHIIIQKALNKIIDKNVYNLKKMAIL